MTYSAGVGCLFGFLFAVWLFSDIPPRPLYAFGCAFLDYPAAVLMNGDLVCLKNAEIVSDDEIFAMILNTLRASQGGEE